MLLGLIEHSSSTPKNAWKWERNVQILFSLNMVTNINVKQTQFATKTNENHKLFVELPERKIPETYLIHIAYNKGKWSSANKFISLGNILPRRPVPIKTHFDVPTIMPRFMLRICRWSPLVQITINSESRDYIGDPLASFDILFPFNATQDPQLQAAFRGEWM